MEERFGNNIWSGKLSFSACHGIDEKNAVRIIGIAQNAVIAGTADISEIAFYPFSIGSSIERDFRPPFTCSLVAEKEESAIVPVIFEWSEDFLGEPQRTPDRASELIALESLILVRGCQNIARIEDIIAQVIEERAVKLIRIRF